MAATTTVRRIVLSTAVLALLASSAQGQQGFIPTPSSRPGDAGLGAGVTVDPGRFGDAGAPAAQPLAAIAATAGAPAPSRGAPPMPDNSSAFTASIVGLGARNGALAPIRGDLKSGLQALSDGAVRKARAMRDGMAPGSLDRHILTWAIALKGGSDVPAAEIAAAAQDLSAWPGLKTLRANSERALWREQRSPSEVIGAFRGSPPQTPEGAMALARAYLGVGESRKAAQLVSSFWRIERMDRSTEAQMLKTFGTLLTKADHKYRMERLLYADRVSDAERVAKLANAETLFRARAAVIRGENMKARLAAVPANQHADPSYQFARAEYLRKTGNVQDAAAVLMAATRDPGAQIDPDAWWNERRIVARDLMELGKAREAYRLVASHSAIGQTESVEAEFHAGWYALRSLRDPGTAAKHFAAIAKASSRPLSQARAYYWLGRAAEAGGPGNSGQYYARAASHGATFYGQLAAAKLGRQPGPISFPKPSSAERQRFESREAVRAIKRLEQIGSDWRADSLYRSLADELQSPGELALLSGMAERRGDHHLALAVGKIAYGNGVDAPALAFPTGVIPSDANISASGKALAYAIARQESAFNPRAKSPVGALGLLQLMPGTAKSLARQAGLSYSEGRLLSDVSYNAFLGSKYLGQQIDQFNGSYVLTFAAYNAGPRRAREWIERFGDPRGKSIDEVVDWIESIPFTETRNYVQRVMENYQVYKIRLGAGFDIERDLRYGRRG
ncbi:lytic transglycosylase domain-containing protein [Antarcticirhabdus aurantiaca]|uniref:Lytic transglycosylase domain-containing protein n=1 Tax=Antarcticirhabdus aurantiaca TaxID=2606717 RepID=A0ACD4NIE0_9HYPH|nr:lytic transglycosylase domain-containing protein [Antarcticirhabdus aurantiaca]WAJ26622.1 lytic transglycosylase domain-containing protein [Jeongeuplla avenae]